MKKIQGLIAAPFTPFNPDGLINVSLVPALVEDLINNGVTGVFVCGSNGEGPSLTIEERMALSEAFVQAVNNRIKVFIHVGHASVAESRKLASHAGQIGADAISAVAAFYFRSPSVANLTDCMAEIASAAPHLPFYYYHIPALTGLGMDMLEFLRLGSKQIPNLAGIKYTAPTLYEYQACLAYNGGNYDVLFGSDEMLLPALAVGAKGAIGSTYTFAAPLYIKVMEAFHKGDLEEARTQQLYLVEMVRILLKYPPIPAQRAVMKMLGFDLGPCRLPLVSLNASQYSQLQQELEDIDFFEKLAQSKANVLS